MIKATLTGFPHEFGPNLAITTQKNYLQNFFTMTSSICWAWKICGKNVDLQRHWIGGNCPTEVCYLINIFFPIVSVIITYYFLEVAGCSKEINQPGLKDQQRWSISKCGSIFAESMKSLSQALKFSEEKSPGNHLVWDKDDQHAMDFVAACANIRAHIFGIPQKSRFDIKC